MRIVTLDGVVVSVENRIIENISRDDELETVQIVIKGTTEIEPYDMGLRCTIEEDGITDTYITGIDDVVRTSLGLYDHRITLVEAYKIFEREITASLQYTQALNTTTYTCLDVIDRGLKLLNIEKTSALGSTRKYDISGIGTRDANDNYVLGNLSGFALQLYNKKAPEIQYNTPSLDEQFREVFLLFDGRPILEDYTTINIKTYNDDNELININEVDEISGHQDIEKNAQRFDIYVENAVSENNVNKQARVYPSSLAYASVRSSDTELTTENFLMEVNEDIERPLELTIYVDVSLEYSLVSAPLVGISFSGVLEVDMTELLFTERAWNALQFNYNLTTAVGNPYFNGIYKNNSLYFSGNQIKGFNFKLDAITGFTKVQTYHLFIATAFARANPTLDIYTVNLTDAQKPSFNTSFRDFMYRLKYVPKEVTRVQLERGQNIGYGTLRVNQDARIVDTELLGNNLQSKLNREGAKELTFTKLVDDYADAFDVRDYYGDYKGNKLVNTRYENGQTLSVLTLSKYYSKISNRIDISNKPRQTEISEENTVRNDIINEYCAVGFEVGSANDSSITTNGISRFQKTFDDTVLAEDPIEFATWEDEILIEATTQGIATTLSFKFQFPNNVSAGKQIKLLGGIYVNNEVPYTDVDSDGNATGIIENATIKFYTKYLPNPNTFANTALTAQMLPEYDSTITLLGQCIDLGERRILKDSGEVYALSYQCNVVSEEDEIFIGNNMAQENGLVVQDLEDKYIYTSVLPITIGQNIDTSLDRKKIVTGTPTIDEVKITSALTTSGFSITFTDNFDSGKFWAIANENGEVYAIVNRLLKDTLYFNFKEKRSD